MGSIVPEIEYPWRGLWQMLEMFQKKLFVGNIIYFEGEIKKFLSKRPLKQAASALYSMQKGSVSKEGINVELLFDDLKPLLEKDLSFLERNYQPALDLCLKDTELSPKVFSLSFPNR